MNRAVLALSLVAGALVIAQAGLPATDVSAAYPRCRTKQLHLTAGAYGEAAQQFIQTLTFTNESSRRCQLQGWPAVTVRGRSGRLVVKTRRVVQGPPSARPYECVVLRALGAASFDVYGADWNALANRQCPKTSALVVTPPGASRTLEVRVRLPSCGVLLVAPLVAGIRDGDAWSTVWKS